MILNMSISSATRKRTPSHPPQTTRGVELFLTLGEEAHKEHDHSEAEAKSDGWDRQPPCTLFILHLGLPFYRLVVGLASHVVTLTLLPVEWGLATDRSVSALAP